MLSVVILNAVMLSVVAPLFIAQAAGLLNGWDKANPGNDRYRKTAPLRPFLLLSFFEQTLRLLLLDDAALPLNAYGLFTRAFT